MIPVTKNQVIELQIDALGSEGEGIGRIDGYAVFVPFALPGEKIKVKIIKGTTRYAVGKLMEVVVASPHRVSAPCPYFGHCGGCNLQHLAYEAQLFTKRQQVVDALQRIGRIQNPNVLPVIGMEYPFGYRNKVQIPITAEGIGFYAPRSHRVMDMEKCLIQQEACNVVLSVVRQWMHDFAISAYNEAVHLGDVRAVMVRTSKDGNVLVVIVTRTARFPKEKELVSRLKQTVTGLTGVVQNINPNRTNVLLGQENVVVWGKDYIEENIDGLTFKVGPMSFLQVNTVQMETLYQTVIDMAQVTKNQTVFDVYCGAGTISLCLAKKAGKVIGFESVPEAIDDARENAILNGVKNAEFICAPAEHAVPRLLKEGVACDVVVLDPPRKGCDEAVLTAIGESGIARIVYVSCNPATLARDVAILNEYGYTLGPVQPVDMFPQSSHIECCCVLEKEFAANTSEEGN